MRIITGTFFILSLLMVQNAYAEPIININTSYYDISGQTNGALRREMSLKGPITRPHYRGNQPKRALASTSWRVNWNANYKPSGAYGCKVDSVEVTVSIWFTYPRWTGRANARPNMGNQWDRFYQALVSHEEVHASHGIAAARQVESELLQLSRRNNCNGFQRDIDNRAREIVQRYDNLDLQFDRNPANHWARLP